MDRERYRNLNEQEERVGVLGYIQHFLKKIDLFGKPITFTFENRDSFNSNIGGIFTIILVMGLLGLFVSEMINVFGRLKPSVTTTTHQVPIINNPESIDLGMDSSFDFAFGIFNEDGINIMNNPLYTEVRLTLATINHTFEGGLRKENKTLETIKYDKCDRNITGLAAHQTLRFNLSNYYCPQNKSYAIKGSYYSDEYKYVKLDVIR